MKKYLEKMIKKMNNTAFDVAAGPMILVAFGIPALLVAAAAVICYFAVKAIMKIAREKKAEKDE